jgi:hypothetical protein
MRYTVERQIHAPHSDGGALLWNEGPKMPLCKLPYSNGSG